MCIYFVAIAEENQEFGPEEENANEAADADHKPVVQTGIGGSDNGRYLFFFCKVFSIVTVQF